MVEQFINSKGKAQPNHIVISLEGEIELFQSYRTIVGAKKQGKLYSSEGLYNWSSTTRKHFNDWSDNAKISIISKEDFDVMCKN